MVGLSPQCFKILAMPLDGVLVLFCVCADGAVVTLLTSADQMHLSVLHKPKPLRWQMKLAKILNFPSYSGS